MFATIQKALIALQQGKMIVLVDDEHRENEGDIVFAAEHVTPASINFMLHHARGLICLAMTQDFFNRLRIAPMVAQNKSKNNTAFGVSIGAKTGITTGISAHDRAHTISVAAALESTAEDIVMPGHIFPLLSRPKGVFERLGHTEGSTDLMHLAGLRTAAVICEVMNTDGSMARLPDLEVFAKKHALPLLTVQEILRYRMWKEAYVELTAESHFAIPKLGQFKIFIFRSQLDEKEHVALQHVSTVLEQPVLVRLHSECLTGDIFLSMRCDCGDQLYHALEKIAQEGGVLLYLRQEGRGIGLSNKIKAYALQDAGYDTVEANEKLGFSADNRDYSVAAKVLQQLSIQTVRLLTNNPKKVQGLTECGITVKERVPLCSRPHKDNTHYLKTKRDRLGHLLNIEEE